MSEGYIEDASMVHNPFWDKKKKLYELKNCPCGGTQDGGEVRVLYVGAGSYSAWNIYCTRCMRTARAKTERETVNNWNKGEYVSTE